METVEISEKRDDISKKVKENHFRNSLFERSGEVKVSTMDDKANRD
jgi:hypothetical protein